jgi:hypothetical protein
MNERASHTAVAGTEVPDIVVFRELRHNLELGFRRPAVIFEKAQDLLFGHRISPVVNWDEIVSCARGTAIPM